MANLPNPLTIPSSSAIPIQFSHQIRTTLDDDNFLLWRSQILPVLRGHGIAGFIDGTKSPPSQTISDETGAERPNPEFEVWQQQDQLILAWIFNSISPSILAQVVSCETSAALWHRLTQLHSTQSMAKILDLKLQLQTLKKGGSSCSQFLQQMQQIADRLRSIGSEVSDQDLVLYTVQGLGSEYETFVTALSMLKDKLHVCSNPLSLRGPVEINQHRQLDSSSAVQTGEDNNKL